MASVDQRQAVRAVFEGSGLFSALSDEEMTGLLNRAVRRHFDDGQVLFVEGEPCEGMYVIASGAVRIFKSSSSDAA